jgi:hypothetical protein
VEPKRNLALAPARRAGELIAEAEADIRAAKLPTRTTERLLGVLNEFGRRIVELERMHQDAT